MPELEDILSRLKGVRRAGDGWLAHCPAHNDNRPSLSLGRGDDGRLLLHCHAGCSWESILSALGYVNEHGKSVEVRRYVYRDETGRELYRKIRFSPKRFIRKPTGVKSSLYGLELLNQAQGSILFLSESEKDADAVMKLANGVVAVSSGGSSTWREAWAVPIAKAAPRLVAILEHNDDAGRKFAREKAAPSLTKHGLEVRVVSFARKNSPEGYDVADAIRDGLVHDALLEAVEETVPWVPGDETPQSPNEVKVSDPSSPVRIWKPFPLATLPRRLESYVRSVSEAIGCDPSFVALSALVCIAGSIGNRRTIQIKYGWSEPAVLWGGLVAKSGRLKTPALDEVTRPLCQREADEIEAEGKRQAEYKRELQQWMDLPKRVRGQRPEEPEGAQRLVVSDTTVEALASRLSAAPAGLLLYRDELAGWIRSFDAYKKNGRGDTQKWLEMHRAGSVIVDRKIEGPISVRRAAVSIVGGVQPEILRESLGLEHVLDGLAARLLFVMPPDKPKKWTDAEISYTTRDSWKSLLEELGSIPYEDEPRALAITPDARKLFVSFYNKHAEKLADAETDALAAALAKLEGYAARFALILELAAFPHASTVGPKSMLAGIELAGWFSNEAERVYETWKEAPAAKGCRELLDWIAQRGGEITERELARGPRKFRTPGAAERALTELVSAGLGKWIEIPTSEAGGRPTRVFRILACRGGDGSKTQNFRENSAVSSPGRCASGLSSPPKNGWEPLI